MGRKLHYVPGSFYRKDDRTGFPQRAERTRKEWNGFIVDESVWEARQPQDLVRGVKDQQNVPEARPLPPNVFVGPIYGQISTDVPPQSNQIPLQSTAGMSANDAIGVLLDDGSVWPSTILAILADGLTLLIGPPIPLGAPAGNDVIDYRVQGSAVFPAGIWDVSFWDDALWG